MVVDFDFVLIENHKVSFFEEIRSAGAIVFFFRDFLFNSSIVFVSCFFSFWTGFDCYFSSFLFIISFVFNLIAIFDNFGFFLGLILGLFLNTLNWLLFFLIFFLNYLQLIFGLLSLLRDLFGCLFLLIKLFFLLLLKFDFSFHFFL